MSGSSTSSETIRPPLMQGKDLIKFLEEKVRKFRPRERIFQNKGSTYFLVSSREEWKSVWKRLEEDVKLFEVISLDTESHQKEENEFCQRLDRNGKVIEDSKTLRFVVIGTPNQTAVLDMYKLKQEFPEELLDILENNRVAIVGHFRKQ